MYTIVILAINLYLWHPFGALDPIWRITAPDYCRKCRLDPDERQVEHKGCMLCRFTTTNAQVWMDSMQV